MTVLFDARCLMESLTGVGRYALQLLRALLASESRHRYLMFVGDYFPDYETPVPGVVGCSDRVHWLFRRRFPMMTSRALDHLLDRFPIGETRIAHFPNYSIDPRASRPANIVTVHDLAFEAFPQFMPADRLAVARDRWKRAAEQATALVVPSESTRQDTVRYWNVPADRIHVVPEGPGLDLQRARRPAQPLPDPYVLSVGTLEPRKNQEALVRAFIKVRRQAGLPHRLVLVGQHGWLVDDLLRLIEESRDDVVWLQYLSDEELVSVYRGAQALVYPSFYEGFGLPVLEAMTLGIPVLTSRVSSIPEVAGDAVLYVDPYSAEDLESALRRLLTDAELRQDLVVRGTEQARRFTWEHAARLTLQVYEKYA